MGCYGEVVHVFQVTHTSGSAHLRLANTDILVGVKAELDTPDPQLPNQGRIVFSVDCSANATPEFEGRGGEDLAAQISGVLSEAYQCPNVFDLQQLSVLEALHSWTLYVDILILECGGNLFDAVSLAVKAALSSTRIPRVTITAVDGGQPEMELSDDLHDGISLHIDRAPLLITLTRIGSHCVVDPTPEEEACSQAMLVMGVSGDGKITVMRKIGTGAFHLGTLKEATQTGVRIGVELNDDFMKKLTEEAKAESREKIGFLKH